MQFKRNDIDELNMTLLLTVEPKDYQEKVEKQLREMRRKANMPGFRVGMVPLNLIKKMYGKAVLSEQLNNVLSEGLFGYVRDNNLNILGEPLPNEEQTPELNLDTDDTFVFAFDLALAPAIDAKLDKKTKIKYYDIELTDKMVDEQVESYADRFGTQKDAESYSEGDIVRGKLSELKEGGLVKENAVLSPAYMKDDKQKELFKDAKKGEEVKFNLFSAYDSEVEVSSMLGISKEQVEEHKGDFSLTIESISHHEPRPLEPELFEIVYGKDNAPKDLEEFRQRVREEMQANLKQDSEFRFGKDVKDAILKKVGTPKYPEEQLKRWLKHSDEKMTDERLEKEFPGMLTELTWQLSRDQLVKELKIEVSEAEVTDFAKTIAKMQYMQYGLTHVEDEYLLSFAQEMLKDDKQAQAIYQRVEENKLYEAMKGVVTVENKSISYDDFGKLQ